MFFHFKLIIRRYSGNNIHQVFNKLLLNSDFYEAIAYFTAKIMYSLNNYASKNDKYSKPDQKIFFRGISMPYTCLIPYIRQKGKIICFSCFNSTSESRNIANNFANRLKSKEVYELTLNFSVVFKINNIYQNGYIPNSINIQDVSEYNEEKEYLFQPFSFFYLKDVKIDFDEKTADIDLETIGKKEILEEKLKIGKDIKISKKNRLAEIK
jgi:hypothetical protein